MVPLVGGAGQICYVISARLEDEEGDDGIEGAGGNDGGEDVFDEDEFSD